MQKQLMSIGYRVMSTWPTYKSANVRSKTTKNLPYKLLCVKQIRDQIVSKTDAVRI